MFKKRFFLALALAGLTGLSFAGLNNLTGTTINTAAIAVECTGGGNETFANLGSSASNYATRNWTGNNGVSWTATDARTDQDLNGDAICLRTGSVQNTTAVTGGIGTLSFNYKRVFSGNSTIMVFVNGAQYGGDVAVSSETPAVFSQAINVSGNVTIEIRNSGNRVVIDDIVWDCNAISGPELQLADAGSTNADCGGLTVDFGSQPVNEYSDAVFTIRNLGSENLTVNDLALSNDTDFTIISPSIPFTVSPSGSAIVLVRFESADGGAKTSTLTIESNDVDEAECTVNLTGIALGACTSPLTENALIAVDSITSSSADVIINNVTADSYLAIVSFDLSLSSLPSNTVNYAVNDSIGGGRVVYTGNSAEFTIEGLDEVSEYSLFVFPYNNVNCTGGPLYSEDSVNTSFVTPEAECIGGSETFSNMGSSASSYATRTWTGDNGVEWTATDARTDQELNGPAIAIRTGSLINNTDVSGGIGILSFNYQRVFTGNSTLRVFVNGVQYGGDITVSEVSPTQYSQAIDVDGDVIIEIENSGNRTIIDDLSWDCFEIPNRPEIQLLNDELTAKACGDFIIDFGSSEANVNNDVIFTIQNRGTVALEVTDLILSDTVNYSIISPLTSSFVVDSLGTQDVTVRFNSALEGNYPATLTIESNDADEASCVIDLNGTILPLCEAPLTEGSVALSNATDVSVEAEVINTSADGYIAVVAISGDPVDAPVNGTEYNTNDTLGSGTVVYVGTDAEFIVEGLDAVTAYDLHVYAYSNVDCIGGPVYSVTSYVNEFETTEVPCVGATESFDNMGSNQSNYTVRTWTGDNGIVWTANDARTDQELNGDAIAVRSGSLTNVSPVSGGIGTLTFNYQRVFSGNSTLKVYVNGTQYGGDITVSATTPAQFSETVNVSGDITVEIENSGNRTIIDDVVWDCYTGENQRQAAPLNINNIANVGEVMLYPNPSNGDFTVQLANTTDEANVTVYDSLGKQVSSKQVLGKENITLSNAAKGIYMVVITSGATVTTKKLVVN